MSQMKEINIKGLSEEEQKKLKESLENMAGYSGCIKELTTVEKIKRGLSRLFR